MSEKCANLLAEERASNISDAWKMGAFVILFVGLSAVFVTYIFDQDLDYLDALYFCVVSFTTVGYGDIAPAGGAGRIFTMVFMLLSFFVLLPMFGLLSSLPFNLQQIKLRGHVFDQFGTSLTRQAFEEFLQDELLLALRRDRSEESIRHITRCEFVLWNLVQAHLVDPQYVAVISSKLKKRQYFQSQNNFVRNLIIPCFFVKTFGFQ